MGKPDAALVHVLIDRGWPEVGYRGVTVVSSLEASRISPLFAHLAVLYRQRRPEKTDPPEHPLALTDDFTAV